MWGGRVSVTTGGRVRPDPTRLDDKRVNLDRDQDRKGKRLFGVRDVTTHRRLRKGTESERRV